MEGVLLVDVTTVRAWIDKATHDIEENKDHLTHLDSAIGDADHGVNLVRGFRAWASRWTRSSRPRPVSSSPPWATPWCPR